LTCRAARSPKARRSCWRGLIATPERLVGVGVIGEGGHGQTDVVVTNITDEAMRMTQ